MLIKDYTIKRFGCDVEIQTGSHKLYFSSYLLQGPNGPGLWKKVLADHTDVKEEGPAGPRYVITHPKEEPKELDAILTWIEAGAAWGTMTNWVRALYSSSPGHQCSTKFLMNLADVCLAILAPDGLRRAIIDVLCENADGLTFMTKLHGRGTFSSFLMDHQTSLVDIMLALQRPVKKYIAGNHYANEVNFYKALSDLQHASEGKSSEQKKFGRSQFCQLYRKYQPGTRVLSATSAEWVRKIALEAGCVPDDFEGLDVNPLK
jgi:hypothetical protein